MPTIAVNHDCPRMTTVKCDGTDVQHDADDRHGAGPTKWHGALRELLYRGRDACRRVQRWRPSRDDWVYADDCSSDYRWTLPDRYAAHYHNATAQGRAKRPPSISDVLVYVTNWATVALSHALLLAVALFTVLYVVPIRSCSLVRRRLSVYRGVIAPQPGPDAACAPRKQALVELVVQLAVIGALNLLLLAVCWPIYRVLGCILGRILWHVFCALVTGSDLVTKVY